MDDIAVGIIAVLIGALLCFRGYAALRLIISLFGAFVGFLLGAGLVAGVTDSGFLQLALSWLVGVVGAVIFGILAYVSYQVAVVLGMAAIGFTIGTSIMAALQVDSGLLTVLVGVAAAVVLAVVAIATDLPAILLIILTVLAGASVVVSGAMVLAGTTSIGRLSSDTVLTGMDNNWWWYALYAVLVIVGLIVQGRYLSRGRRSMRQQWAAPRGAAVPAR
ncbi:MAG: TMEM198/TM7SF3 family protein [Microlunatus sp.]|nr:TMEM198/TM7SF3 family protein [Microlunatus sp.]MDN5805284.1 TMEM198/TM7SF3 family protein [Microlunatus sp.]